MTKVLLIAAALGLAVSSAQACDFHRSAEAKDVDQTKVASITVPQSEPVVVPENSVGEQQVETIAE